jgi:Domain of unknown function (DUF4357)
MLGKTIRLYLVEGVPSGIITAEIMNWTGKATVCPRSQLAELASRDEVRKTGIYILSGEDVDNPLQEIIYIGESENVLDRLKIHNNDPKKDFWIKTFIFTNKDDNLTKGHVRYLESRLIQIASEAKRARIENSTNPDYTILPESDIADMEYFIEQIKLLLPVLGLTFALPLSTLAKNQDKLAQTPEIQIESPLFKMTYSGVEAYAQEINNEFIVFKDSTVRKKDNPSLSKTTKEKRNRLVKESKLIQSSQNDYWILIENLPFNSPSGAADFVGGASLNGRVEWKVKDSNQTYANWQESQLANIET